MIPSIESFISYTQIKKVLKNCDELFERDELSAVADPGWPDCFNSGLFVFRPSLETFQVIGIIKQKLCFSLIFYFFIQALLQHALQNGSFDGGDQVKKWL